MIRHLFFQNRGYYAIEYDLWEPRGGAYQYSDNNKYEQITTFYNWDERQIFLKQLRLLQNKETYCLGYTNVKGFVLNFSELDDEMVKNMMEGI